MGRAWGPLGSGSVGVYVALFVLAVAVRGGVGAGLLSQGPAAFVLASDDGDAYDAAARAQASGLPVEMTPRMAAKWGPAPSVMERWPQGYWLFLGAQYRVFGSAYASTVVLQAILGAGGVLATYALATAVLSSRAAVLAGAAVALSSTGVYMSSALYAEALYTPLVLTALALSVSVVRRRRNAIWWPVLAGVALGLAEATRPLALPVLVALLVAGLWPGLITSSHARFRAAGGMGAGFVLGVAPFVAHDLVILGHVTTFTVGGAAAMGDLGSAGGLGLPERLNLLFVSGGWAPLGEPLVSLLGAATAPVRCVEALLGLAGLAWLARPGTRTAPAGWHMLLACLAMLLPPLFLGLPLVRYRAVADPLLIVAMFASLEAAWRAIPHPRLALQAHASRSAA